MDTDRFKALARAAEEAREKAELTFARNARYAEFKKLYSGAMIVFAGYLLAAIYLLIPPVLS